MAYTDIAEMAADDDLRQRLYACVASLGWDNGAMWVDRWVWQIVAGDGSWTEAWASAAVAEQTPAEPDATDAPVRRGWDAAVITDQQILERVRAVKDDKGDI